MAAGLAGARHGADPAKLTEGLGERWATIECSYKLHACCRHTHPSADALLALMQEHHLKAEDVAHVTAHVHQGAINVLGSVGFPETIHQSKFSMGFVLALIALYGRAGISDFTETALRDPKTRAFHGRVEMILDPEIERAASHCWGGRVVVGTRDGRRLETRIAGPRGDPENTLTRAELEDKAQRLAAHEGAATPE